MLEGKLNWRVVAVLFTIGALNFADRTAISSVFPLLRTGLGMSDVALGAVGSLFLWSYAAGSPVAGRLGDALPRSRIVVGSLAAWSLITVATGFVSSSAQLLTLRVLLGLAECAYLPAAVALIADHHCPSQRATAMSIHVAGLYVGLIGGGVLAGYLGDIAGWRSAFWVLGAVGVGLCFVAHRALGANRVTSLPRPETRGALGTALQDVRVMLRVRTYPILIVQAMLIAVGTWIFYNWLPLYFKETFQMNLAGAGFSATFMLQTAAALGILAGGRLSDRLAARHLSRRLLLQAVCYLAAAPFLLAFAAPPNYYVINGCIFLFAFLQALGASNENPIVCDLLPLRLRATAVAIMNTTNCMAAGAGVLATGVLKQRWGLAGTFLGIAVLVAAAGVIALAGYLFFLRSDLQRFSEEAATSDTTAAAADCRLIPPSETLCP